MMKGGYNTIILKHTLDNSIFYRRNLIILQIHFQAFRFFPSALVHGPIHCSKANNLYNTTQDEKYNIGGPSSQSLISLAVLL